MQKQIATIEKQQAQAGKSRAVLEKEKEKALREKAKADEEKRKKEEAALFKPVQIQKVPFGVDPKTVLCAFYKAGTCTKGAKCKFSHDMDVGRKVEKKNLYEDSREDKMKGAYAVRLVGDGCCRGSEGLSRYDGKLGRGEAPERSPVEKRKPSDNYGRKYALVIACARKCSSFWISRLPDRLQILHPSD